MWLGSQAQSRVCDDLNTKVQTEVIESHAIIKWVGHKHRQAKVGCERRMFFPNEPKPQIQERSCLKHCTFNYVITSVIRYVFGKHLF